METIVRGMQARRNQVQNEASRSFPENHKIPLFEAQSKQSSVLQPISTLSALRSPGFALIFRRTPFGFRSTQQTMKALAEIFFPLSFSENSFLSFLCELLSYWSAYLGLTCNNAHFEYNLLFVRPGHCPNALMHLA